MKNLFISGLSLFIALLLTEAGLRIFAMDYYVHNGMLIKSFTNPKLKDVLPRDNPRRWEYDWYYEMDEDFFKKEFVHFGTQSVHVEKDRPRVLCIGDSGTFGSGVNFEDSFCHQLKSKFHQYEFINVGVPGMSTIDELNVLIKLLPLKPDHVILGYFIPNDINISYTESLWIKDQHHPWLYSRSRSRLLNLLKFALTAMKRNEHKRPDGSLAIVNGPYFDERGLNLRTFVEGEMALYNPPTPTLKRAYQVFENLMEKFKELSMENHFSFQVALIPTRSMIFKKYIHLPDNVEGLKYFQNRGYPMTNENLDFMQPQRMLLDSCKKVGIQCRSLMEKITDENREKILLEDDDHMTSTGHLLTTELFSFPTL